MTDKKDKSFRAFLGVVSQVPRRYPTEFWYFGEVGFWIGLGCFLTWLVFPHFWDKSSDLRGLVIFIPSLTWAVLRGVYVLWKEEEEI